MESVVMGMLEQLQQIYQGKKVFLTGHTGFKGSWMLKVLSLLGAEVKGYALAPQTKQDLYCLIGGDKLCQSVIADIRNSALLQQSMIEFQPDYVFHLAAQPLVRLSYQIPAETFEVNAIGTANVLDGIAKLTKACCAVMITTDKVYHNNEWLYPYRENDRLGGYDPYSASKACAELVIDSYRNSFFNKEKIKEHQKAIAVARAGNVIGGGDWSQDRLIPDIVKSLESNLPLVLRNPNAVRPWQHVLEPLVGYLILGGKLHENGTKYSQAYNFGPQVSDTLTVEEMVKKAIAVYGKGSYTISKNTNEPHEAGLLKLDVSKAKEELQWHPKMNALQTIGLTMDWYAAFYNGDDMNGFTEKQINLFLHE